MSAKKIPITPIFIGFCSKKPQPSGRGGAKGAQSKAASPRQDFFALYTIL